MSAGFRFGVQMKTMPPDWRSHVQAVEAMGYSSILFEDHFDTQYDPFAAMVAVGTVTESLAVGSLVAGVDFRHPAVVAKAAATAQALIGGRVELGIGAGWMATDYEQSGMAFESAGVRIERLGEALQIMRSLWTNDTTSFDGEHFCINNMPLTVDLGDNASPKIMIGGGGRKVLTLAGANASIIGINPSLPSGMVTQETINDMLPSRVAQKVSWVEEGALAAGRGFDEIELSTMAFAVEVGSGAKAVRKVIADSTGLTLDQVATCSLFLTGSGEEIVDILSVRQENTGIGYVVVQDGPHLEQFAKQVVQPLTKVANV